MFAVPVSCSEPMILGESKGIHPAIRSRAETSSSLGVVRQQRSSNCDELLPLEDRAGVPRGDSRTNKFEDTGIRKYPSSIRSEIDELERKRISGPCTSRYSIERENGVERDTFAIRSRSTVGAKSDRRKNRET